MIERANGSAARGNNEVATGEKGPGGATLVVFNNALYMLWRGTDGQFNSKRSFDGVIWRDKKATRQYGKYVSDGAAIHGGRLHVALTRNNNQISICSTADGLIWNSCYNVNTAYTPNPASIISNGTNMWLAWASTMDSHEVNVSTYQGGTTWTMPSFPTTYGRPGMGLLPDGTPFLMFQWSICDGWIDIKQLDPDGTWSFRTSNLVHYSYVTPTPIRPAVGFGTDPVETVFVGTDGQVNLDWF